MQLQLCGQVSCEGSKQVVVVVAVAAAFVDRFHCHEARQGEARSGTAVDLESYIVARSPSSLSCATICNLWGGPVNPHKLVQGIH